MCVKPEKIEGLIQLAWAPRAYSLCLLLIFSRRTLIVLGALHSLRSPGRNSRSEHQALVLHSCNFWWKSFCLFLKNVEFLFWKPRFAPTYYFESLCYKRLKGCLVSQGRSEELWMTARKYRCPKYIFFSVTYFAIFGNCKCLVHLAEDFKYWFSNWILFFPLFFLGGRSHSLFPPPLQRNPANRCDGFSRLW